MSNILIFPARAVSSLNSEFLSGHGPVLDLQTLLEPITEVAALKEYDGLFIDIELLQELADETLRRDFEDNNKLDAWLSPRIHFALRFPPRLASDPRVWTWLAVSVFHRYIQRRWAQQGVVNLSRYVDNKGLNLTNGLSRLWWAAEMTRNGPDYSPTGHVLARVRTAQFALELAYSSFRPAAIAFSRVCEESNPPLTDIEMRQLSTRMRAYLSTTSLEALGVSHDESGATDPAWLQHRPSLGDVLRETALLEGPQHGRVSKESIDSVEAWMKKEIVSELRSHSKVDG